MTPRVLHVIDTLSLGGAERHLVQIAGYLAGRGVKQRVAVLYREPQDATLVGILRDLSIDVVPLGASSRLSSLPLKFLPLVRCCREFRPSVISTQLVMSDILGRAAAWSTGTPAVSYWMNANYEEPARSCRGRRAQVAMTWLEVLDRMTAPAAARFLAPTRAVAEPSRQALGVDKARCAVIPISIDMARFPDPPPCRNGTGEGLRLIHAGRHHPQKGLGTLVEALGLVPKDLDVSVDLFGAGPLTRSLEEQARRLGVPSRVRFRGLVPDVAPFLLASEAFVFPSLYEGFGLAYLEALAAGLPVIASDLESFREIDPRGLATRFFRPGDPASLAEEITRLARNPGLRSELGENSRSIAETYDVPWVGKMYYDLFSSLAAPARG